MKKDIVEKQLEAYTDVAADIINGVFFYGEPVIAEDELELERNAVLVHDQNGEYRELIRDVLFCVKKHDIPIAYIGFENQSGIDNTMPLRVMGMDYGCYYKGVKELQSKNKKENYLAYTKQIHEEQKLLPVISLIINYGKPWTGPEKLRDMLNFTYCEFFRPYVADYSVNIINLAKDRELYKRFHSDFRLVAQYLGIKDSTEALNDFMRQEKQGITHVREFLDIMSVISSDKRYEKIKKQLLSREEKEEITMCLIADEFENRGIKKGIERNTVTSIKNIMINLKITVDQAMDALGIPLVEREKYMQLVKN